MPCDLYWALDHSEMSAIPPMFLVLFQGSAPVSPLLNPAHFSVLPFPNISVLWVLITQHGTSLTPLGIWCMVSGPKPYQLSQDSHFSKFPTWCVWTLKLERCYSRFLFPRTGTILLCSYFLLWTSLCFFSVPESIIGSFEAHSWKHPLKKGLLDGG